MLTFRPALRRWLLPAAIYPALLACNDRRLARPDLPPEQSTTNVFVQNPQPKLDILFMIDNSDSMKEEQQNLIVNFPRFMQVLEGLIPAGTKLDAHIAVVSSDLGVATTGIGRCATNGGDNGAFQHAARGACTPPRGSFIISDPAGNNFDGTIEDAFACIAALGTMGCGFEHQLASVRRALGGDPDVPMPPDNAGFLRRNARLGIILITDEDDCSAPVGSDLFTPDTSVYGPVDSYRCNEYGHLCGGSPPPRAVVSGLDCHSNETASGRLIKVRDFVDFFRSLKPNADDLRVAAITGPPMPYATHQDAGVTEISPSCTSAFGMAAPAVRLKDFIEAFGSAGLFETICTGDFGMAMEHIAKALVPTGKGCVEATLYDRDPRQAGVQPDCTVTESHFQDDATRVENAVPSCDVTGGAVPCWQLANDDSCPAPGKVIAVDHGPAGAPPNTQTSWTCRVCPQLATPTSLPGCAN